MTRTKYGGNIYRQMTNRIARHERSELDALTRLLRVAATPDTQALLVELIEGKLQRLEWLNQLNAIGEGKSVADEEAEYEIDEEIG